MGYFDIPDGVHTEPGADGRLVVLSKRNGSWHALNRTGGDIYHELGQSADLEQVVDDLVRRYPKVAPDRVRDDVQRMVAELIDRGLLESRSDYTRRPAAVLMAAAPYESARLPRNHRFIATLAFLIAVILLQLPFRVSTNIVAALKRRLTRRDATVPEASHYLAAARVVTRHYPGRVACLELSLTAVLAAILVRQRINWCFGFSSDPRTFHSWIETADTPVTGPTDDPISPTYRRVLRV
jgi:hypothetical protein